MLLPLLTAVALTADVNLLPNPGFELGEGDLPAFWQQRTPDDVERRLTWDREVAHTGACSASLTNRAAITSRWRTGHLGDLVLESGGTAELTAWVRTRGVTGSAHLRLYFMAPDGTILEQPGSTKVTGDRDWTPVKLTFTVPAKPSRSMVYLELEGPGQAWFDDVSLVAPTAAEWRGADVGDLVLGLTDAWSIEHYETVRERDRTFVRLAAGHNEGQALYYFPGETGRYTPVVEGWPSAAGESTLTLHVNDREVATQPLPRQTQAGRPAPVAFPAVSLQQHARLRLVGRTPGGPRAAFASLTLRAAGRFEGALLPPAALPPPPLWRVHRTTAARGTARASLGAYLDRLGTKPLTAAREQELAACQTPADWRAYQQRIRARLTDYFGELPERGPLHATVHGTIDRDAYTIEKVVFDGFPNCPVPASFYRPKHHPLPAPAALLVCGHSAEGKGYHLYHECCLGLVLKGYCVLAIDPLGQGERSEFFDPATLDHRVGLTTPQHQQIFRGSYLVGRTFVGWRTWDASRGIDYLLTRPEVDPARLAVVGNSGGGQMALMAAAFDERIQVCAAAHPGGPEENTWRNGQGLRDRELLDLIAPRPCRFIVGEDSGEGYHADRVKSLQRIYAGLGAPERCELKWVAGVHNLETPKRVAVYEWLNRWLKMEAAGSDEPPLTINTAEELWCSRQGRILLERGEPTRALNARRFDELAPRRTAPTDRADAERQVAALRAAVAQRLGLRLAAERPAPTVVEAGTLEVGGPRARLFRIELEPGIVLPAVRLDPAEPAPQAPLMLHVGERGKPQRADQPSLVHRLVELGYPVVAIDVRGVGENDPQGGQFAASANGYDPFNWNRDSLAINCFGYLGRTLVAMQAEDVVRAVDALPADRPIVAVGEGLGGVWCLLAAGWQPRLAGVVTVGTVYSFRTLIANPYHEVRGYWWLPQVVATCDLLELSTLAAPRPVTWVGAANELAQPADEAVVNQVATWPRAVARALGGDLAIVPVGHDAGAAVRAALGTK